MSRASCRLWLPMLGVLALVLALPPERGGSAPAPLPVSRGQFTNSIGMKLARIPAGRFMMGSPAEEPGHSAAEVQHEVEISRAFYLGVYLVTQREYEKVIGTNPSGFSAAGGWPQAVKGMDTRDFPVETVTWHDAVA